MVKSAVVTALYLGCEDSHVYHCSLTVTPYYNQSPVHVCCYKRTVCYLRNRFLKASELGFELPLYIT